MQQHDTHLTFPSSFLHSSFFMSFSSAAPRARQLHKHHSSLCSSQLLFCSSSSFLLPRPRPLSLCVTLAAIASQALAAFFWQRRMLHGLKTMQARTETAEEEDSGRSRGTSYSQGSGAGDRRASPRSRGQPSRRDRSRNVGVQSEVSTIVGDSASEAGQEVRG